MENKHLEAESARASFAFLSKPLAFVAAAFIGGAVACAAASAAPADTPPAPAVAAEKTETLEAIVVTGSRISRRDYQSDSPIVTIDQASLQAAGQPTLDRAIGEMPQFAAAQGMSEVGDVQGATGFAGGHDLIGVFVLQFLQGKLALTGDFGGSMRR